MIRNAFAHGPISPKWSIDENCRNRVFEIAKVMKLDTTKLDGKPFDWRHYGGPLALFRLCRFVRSHILKDVTNRRKPVSNPTTRITQVDNLILKEVDKIPADAVRVDLPQPADGSVHLGGGYYLRPNESGRKLSKNLDRKSRPRRSKKTL